jgi:phosphatidylserine/phosphatidylglycerophosphate/cardiolipin synthase-like enzyme
VPEADHDAWPDELKSNFTDVPIAIARTRGKTSGLSEVREIEALFLDLIKAARKTVYIETQYFSSRTVAEAIAARLQESAGPEFVVINPREGRGWLDEGVMGPARYELMKAVEERDRHGRFRIYTPVTEGGADIYVHAKIMIVDDLFLRVGSANLNNRSMGLDSECDLLIDARKKPSAKAAIRQIRADLLGEHLGRDPEECGRTCEEAGSLIAAIEKLRGSGRTLVPFEPPKPGKLQEAMAESELLDPEGPDELFERKARPGLLSRLRRR